MLSFVFVSFHPTLGRERVSWDPIVSFSKDSTPTTLLYFVTYTKDIGKSKRRNSFVNFSGSTDRCLLAFVTGLVARLLPESSLASRRFDLCYQVPASS